jgi:(p)ppGpp synthase/HD superfamily hydrolase
MEQLLDKAILMAVQAHHGQTDKAGLPYILHPMRIAMSLDTIEAKIVAFLHDVLEDTDITVQKLYDEGFPDHIVEAVDAVTRRVYYPENGIKTKEVYHDMIRRIRDTSKLAVQVKIADLYDNLNPSRMVVLSEEEVGRMKRYHKALRILHGLEK